jgi:hypothetical protein
MPFASFAIAANPQHPVRICNDEFRPHFFTRWMLSTGKRSIQFTTAQPRERIFIKVF